LFRREQFIKSIFEINSPQEFNELAVQLFHHQASSAQVYKDFLSFLNIRSSNITEISDIPCLPIQFFKKKHILTEGLETATIFRSSGTSSSITSEHLVHDLSLYEKSFKTHFESTYGSCEDLVILALLPAYLERKDSSLVYMVNRLIELTKNSHSSFYEDNYQELVSKIESLIMSEKRIVLFGVTFGLLQIIEKFTGLDWKHVTIIETGGMKGRGRELTRTELHKHLKTHLRVSEVHSEYGMTELLSQGYSNGEVFTPAPWMKVMTREVDDPFTSAAHHRTGGINVIDLANIDSCAFLATDDLGKTQENGTFEVLGRFDHSDVRGCNLLVQDI
jgi:phenylacetate-coenzyme A ligase PaaK-like adenylate-forming protein